MEKYPSSKHVVNFQDCDIMGHLNNARYLDYFINARESHLRDFYQMDARAELRAGKGWVVGGHSILYLRPADLYEEIAIRTCLLHFDESNVLVEHLMTDASGEQLKALMWSKYSYFNARTGKRDQHPEEWLSLMSAVKVDGVRVEEGIEARVKMLKAPSKMNV